LSPGASVAGALGAGSAGGGVVPVGACDPAAGVADGDEDEGFSSFLQAATVRASDAARVMGAIRCMSVSFRSWRHTVTCATSRSVRRQRMVIAVRGGWQARPSCRARRARGCGSGASSGRPRRRGRRTRARSSGIPANPADEVLRRPRSFHDNYATGLRAKAARTSGDSWEMPGRRSLP